jgi:hypothetical protein
MMMLAGTVSLQVDRQFLQMRLLTRLEREQAMGLGRQ